MLKIVNGASQQRLSGGAPKQIVLLLHGFGSSGADMIALAPSWQPSLPDALFLAPHAPERISFGAGYQWWGLTSVAPQALAEGAARTAPAIDAFIDRNLAPQPRSGPNHADLFAEISFDQRLAIEDRRVLTRNHPLTCDVALQAQTIAKLFYP